MPDYPPEGLLERSSGAGGRHSSEEDKFDVEWWENFGPHVKDFIELN